MSELIVSSRMKDLTGRYPCNLLSGSGIVSSAKPQNHLGFQRFFAHLTRTGML